MAAPAPSPAAVSAKGRDKSGKNLPFRLFFVPPVRRLAGARRRRPAMPLLRKNDVVCVSQGFITFKIGRWREGRENQAETVLVTWRCLGWDEGTIGAGGLRLLVGTVSCECSVV